MLNWTESNLKIVFPACRRKIIAGLFITENMRILLKANEMGG